MDVREFIRGNGGRRGRRHLVIPTVGTQRDALKATLGKYFNLCATFF